VKHLLRCILVCVFIFTGQVGAWADKITVVLSRALLPYEQAWEGFKLNIRAEVQKMNMEGNEEKGKQIMQNISPDSSDLVVTIGSEATVVARRYLGAIPVVYTMVLEEPKFSERVSSGVLMQVKIEKQLETIIRMFPEAKGIGVIYNLHYSGAVINQARQIVKKLNAALIPIAVESQTDIPSALNKITADKIDVLWSVVDPTVAKPEAIQLLIRHSLKEKIPFIGLSRYHVKAGALAALSVDYRDIGAQTADLVKKIIQYGKSKPVEYPRRLILFVNSQTQNKLGIKKLPQLSGIQIKAE